MTNTQDAAAFEARGRMGKVKVSDILGPSDFWYAGKGSRKNPMVLPVLVRLDDSMPHRVIRLVQVDDGQVLTTVRASSDIWAAPLAPEPAAQDAPEVKPEAPKTRTPRARRKADNPVKALARGAGLIPAAQGQEVPVAVEPVAVELAPKSNPGKPPANFIELARSGNTPQARAYWLRRCRSYYAFQG